MKTLLMLVFGFSCVAGAAEVSQLNLGFPVGLFLGSSEVGQAIRSLGKQEHAEIAVSSVKYLKTGDLDYKVCAFTERSGGDFIKAVGVVTGEIKGKDLGGRGGSIYEVKNVSEFYAPNWDACDEFLAAAKP